MNYHFIGIGGVGMAAVAELLLARGNRVSGSDRAPNANTERLGAMGATISIGQDAVNVPDGATVVVSSAIKETNPELVRARELGLEVIHRSEALALAGTDRVFVAVAGAHGKTTTSAMLAHVLAEAGTDPSWAIGASLAGGSSGARLGAGPVLVAEADESDGSFLNYRPGLEIITNIEPDHLDHYGSPAKVEEAFAQFAALRGPGLLVINNDNDETRRLIASDTGRLLTYGVSDTGADTHLHYVHETRSVTLITGGKPGPSYRLDLPQNGEHMGLNACAVLGAAMELGLDPDVILPALATFPGTGRRAELVGEAGGVRVIDDYAHHPTEVRSTLLAAREDPGRTLVLFQPHMYSRTRDFAAEFAAALSLADEVVVTGVYGAREEPMPGVEGNLITDRMDLGRFIPDLEEAARAIAELARSGDTVWTMGAGSVTTVAPRIVDLLS